MVKRNIVLYFGIALIALGCSTTGTQYIDPEFQNNRTRDSVSLLIIDRERFSEVSTQHVFSHLNTIENQVFYGNASMAFSQVTDSDVIGLLDAIDLEETPFESRMFEMDDMSMQIMIPVERTLIKHDRYLPRFVLILDQYFFRQITLTSEGSVYAGHERSVTRRGLYFETNYAIWDNERRDLIGWGNISADQSIMESPSYEDYVLVLQKAFQKIISKSPFYAQR